MKKKNADAAVNPPDKEGKKTIPLRSRKKILGIAAAATAAAIAVTIFLLVMQQPTTQTQTITQGIQNPKLGMVIMPPTERPTLEQVQNAYAQAASTGIGRSNVYMMWPTIEPQQGTFNWQIYDLLMGLNRQQHLNVTLYFSIINNDEFGPFPQWLGQPQLDENLANQTASALDTILSRYYIVDYVIIGGDMDIYFRDHPGDIPKYADFFNSVYAKLKAKHPDVKFGNWFSLNDLINHYDFNMVSKLDQGDFVAYSFSPVDLTFYQNQGPDGAARELQNMFNYSGGKNVALMEIGWSTDKSVNGSDDSQVKFIQDAFDFYRKNESKIEFMTWYRQYDRPFETCYDSLNTNVQTSFGNKFLLNNTAAYLCGSGLVDMNNNTKPGWNEFKNQVQMSPNS